MTSIHSEIVDVVGLDDRLERKTARDVMDGLFAVELEQIHIDNVAESERR